MYSTKNKLEKVCHDHDYCYVEMPSEENKILKYNYGEKSIKAPFILYADLECLLEKMHLCQNNPEKSYTVKKQCIHLLFTHCAFDSTKNKFNCYSCKDCMEKFGKDLKKHATKIINYEKKEMIPLTDKENKFYEKQRVCYICKKGFSTDDDDNKKSQKVRDHCHYTGKLRRAAHSICNLR